MPSPPTPEYFDLVCLGGGVAAGYWAEEVAALSRSGGSSSSRPRICIVSADPDGLAPYERSEISKECLRPSATHLRDWQAWGNKTFPYTSTGSDRSARNARWYRDKGVSLLSWCECYEVDVANASLKIFQYSDRARTKAKAKQRVVIYESLLVATGSGPRRLHGDKRSGCFCVEHADLKGARIEKPEMYGLGSAHYLRDIGDCIKLVKALSTPVPAEETGSGRGAAQTVALVGGGLMCMEVAAAIAVHYPDVRPLLLLGSSRLLPDLLSPELSDFYEDHLRRAGVVVQKDMRAERLWGLEEQGEFVTLEKERVYFGPCPRGFTECRGVVARTKQGKLIHIPARMVFIGIGAVPNSEMLRGQLRLEEDGGICVDAHCRALIANEKTGNGAERAAGQYRPIYAAGDVATFPLPLEGSKRFRYEHIQNARDMAVVTARNMMTAYAAAKGTAIAGLTDGFLMYQPVPGFSSRILDLSWRFYGIPDGEVVVLGISEFPTTRTMGAFWVRGERVVGAFLEGGTVEQQIAVAQVTRLRPRVISANILKGTQLGDFLEDPGSIEASDESDLSQLLMCCRCV